MHQKEIISFLQQVRRQVLVQQRLQQQRLQQEQQQERRQELVQLQELELLFYHRRPRRQLKKLPKEVSLSCQLSFEGRGG